MFKEKNTVLIVDDHAVNRAIVKRILETEYRVLEAENGQIALELLTNHRIDVVLLDVIMPVMNGYEFLEKLSQTELSALPVIVMTAQNDPQSEEKALDLGALDFVLKPVQPKVLLRRVRNAVIRNQMAMLEEQKYLMTHDTLTGLYNRAKVFDATRHLLDAYPNEEFALVRFDINKFRLYNTAMGEAEGDRLLQFIGSGLHMLADQNKYCTYGRIDADVFCMCEPNDPETVLGHIRQAQEMLTAYRDDYAIEATFGIYEVKDPSLSIEEMYTCASLAADKCKRRFNTNYAYYDDAMGAAIRKEQSITTEMRPALKAGEFHVYLQPKYDITTDLPCGAEALVRWIHPTKGLISPGDFIPVFEKNGFIASLDYFMWEAVCKLLRRWLDEGQRVCPVSVNMSRVSLYNPHVADVMVDLVQRYRVPPELLNLEVTESAYMSNPDRMERTIEQLRSAGFLILMDDFGSGYSSLNMLKNINVDILKIDMKFMPSGKDDGKSEKILSSVVRMAGWIGMPVIAEGVETQEQKEFLESIGCGYVQGYYYARPMPVEEYEALMQHQASLEMPRNPDISPMESAIWSASAQVESVLSGVDVPVAILEHSPSITQIIRANHAYLKAFGSSAQANLGHSLSPEDAGRVQLAIQDAIARSDGAQCDISYIAGDGHCKWVRLRLKKIASIPEAHILCCIFLEITQEKFFELRCQKIVRLLDDREPTQKTMLIVDDSEASRSILRNLFEPDFQILEAENGKIALDALASHADEIGIILLDLIMPEMSGQDFLSLKNERCPTVPVVVISGERDAAVQLGMLKNGVNDYILKPFDPEITKQRIENVLNYNSRFRILLSEYRNAISQDSPQA